MCNLACPAECEECGSAGTCTKCKDTHYGLPACNLPCSDNCVVTSSGRVCNEISGTCLGDCKAGFFGAQCQTVCSMQCATVSCDRGSGACTPCKTGHRGANCTATCSGNCKPGNNGRTCGQLNGFCDNGCNTGFYWVDCVLTCPTNCANKQCDANGLCTGCTEGYYGSTCANQCSGCFELQCSSVNGDCKTKCVAGKYGTKCISNCLETCNDSTCDQTTGKCEAKVTYPTLPPAASTADDEELSTGAIIGIAAGCFGALVIIIVFAFCCFYQMRNAENAKNEIFLPSELLEGLSNHHSVHDLHEHESTSYPVARVVGDDENDFVLF
ncbi:hypothetical protein DPMN_038698 [Dreissena polymorpha]|uniref:Uncharacterized protein n=1 Tax=Dreissena polymorpha TaxID=45954 RepID=A0A9D4RQZ5_DREPO|nr:hypothetical protein DPMN_038698 [Dreissena polymorpha]